MEGIDIFLLLCYNEGVSEGNTRTHEKSIGLKEVTKILINDFKIRELGHDFMGYSLQKGDIYTFHHLIIPKRQGGQYTYWNGAVLCSTPHQYLHAIEAIEHKYFDYITDEMEMMKHKGFLDEDNLLEINNILCEFEWNYKDYHTRKGRKVLRPEYLNRKFNKNMPK